MAGFIDSTTDSTTTIVDHVVASVASDEGETAFVGHLDYEVGVDSPNVRRASLRDLHDRMRRGAAALRDAGMNRGDRVVIALPAGLEFVSVLLAALAARVVAVPVPLPAAPRPDMGRARLAAVLRDCAAVAVVAPEDHIGALRDTSDASVTWLASTDLEADRTPGELEGPVPEDVAYLQYTSGSTATPRGVVISHHNVVANVCQITEMLGGPSDGTAVCWAPHYHDMGLLLGIFRPILESRSTVLMSPTAFIERPVRWLEAMSDYRAVESCAPPFAYDLAARRATDDDLRLDLTAWEHAIVGAEPIDPRLLASFARRFAPAGFRPEAFSPGYGLAETTLAATFTPEGLKALTVAADALRSGSVKLADPDSGVEVAQVVSCGRPARDIDVRIVDPDSCRQQPDGELGEVWVAGPNVASGYWSAPQATAEVFDASLRDGDATEATGYVRTGDLGFVHEGELHIAGRIKDLVIIRGQNFLPQDFERTVASASPHIRPGGVAAFNVDWSDGQALGIVFEVARSADVDFDRLIPAVRRALSESHAVAASLLVATRANSLPKTSSGKLQRRLTRQMLVDGELVTLHRWSAPE